MIAAVVIASHRHWRFENARIECDRWLWPEGIVRAVSVNGLVQDERLTLDALGRGTEGVSRARLMIILSGSMPAIVDGRSALLEPGAIVATPRVEQLITHGSVANTLSIDWTSTRSIQGCSRLGVRAFEAARLAHVALQGSADGATQPMRQLRRVLSAEGIELDGLGEGTVEDRAAQQTMTASDAFLSNLRRCAGASDWMARTGATARTFTRRVQALNATYGLHGIAHKTDWRASRDFTRLLAATMFLTHALGDARRVAHAVGYGSVTALCHAFSHVGLPSPAKYRALARAA